MVLTEQVLAGAAANPNVGAALIIGLGCETCQATDVAELARARAPGRPYSSVCMTKQRPFLQAFLGLMLWVQGVAIAATPLPAAAAAEPAAATSSAMPCHGQIVAKAAPCDCCDGDCDNMVGCAVGSFAAQPAALLQAEAPGYIVVAARASSPLAAVVPLRLRPPITSHA